MHETEPASYIDKNLRRFHIFQELNLFRVHEVLLVSSLYDSFILEEDGQLYEKVLSEYHDLNLSRVPVITRVSNGKRALKMLVDEPRRFDLVITSLNLGDMDVLRFARRVHKHLPDMPVVLLTYNNRELNTLMERHDTSDIEKAFVWQGDFRIFIAITKYIEDKRNVAHDTKEIGLQVIIVVEDNVSFYSAYLPMIYTEIFRHSQTLISEGINVPDKLLRLRARPKILLCSSYEEAWHYYKKYEEYLLGIVVDVEFPRKGNLDPKAGIRFARAVKKAYFDVPVLLQSDSPDHAQAAHDLGAAFILKTSPLLLHEVQQFMHYNFSFGPFIFRLPDGTEVGRAENLRSMEEQIKIVPIDSIRYHAENNHFSNWLKARTEFWLAHKLRPRRVSEYQDVESLRLYLLEIFKENRKLKERGRISDFNSEFFDPEESFARLGGGSLGGKARGLAFTNMLVNHFNLREKFPGINITVPPTLVLGTDVFDQFLEENDLRNFAVQSEDDEEIKQRFLEAGFPEAIKQSLEKFLRLVNTPLAVRSSSLLEDSRYMPFTGVYSTYMLPNDQSDLGHRLDSLVQAIKLVYASTFSSGAKLYLQATHYRLEEEKMAVIIQKVVGARHGDRFYPDMAGVARSYNFYPRPPMEATDGIASVALGLGELVVEGGHVVRFCPRYPTHPMHSGDIQEILDYSQKRFLAITMGTQDVIWDPSNDDTVKSFGIEVAEEDGTLNLVGSTYVPENDALYPGVSRRGIRVITFDPILQAKWFPLGEILQHVIAMGKWGMSSQVEVEFAANLSVGPDEPKDFAILQVRPVVMHEEMDELDLDNIEPSHCIVQSPQILGHGVIDDIYDVVMVDPESFKRSHTRAVGQELAGFNSKLMAENRPYLLIGMGRIGSADPWLGIPVLWEQVSGARVIVETGFEDFRVVPSQGSHFFQNLVSFKVGYFTVNEQHGEGFVSWSWLLAQQPVETGKFTRHIRFEHPLVVKMNGRSGAGVILKPE